MKNERIIDVGRPKKISFEKSLKFCLKGIKHRLLRSSLTQMVVVMAVAFFMVLLTESVIQSSVSRGVQGESATVREPSLLLAHLQRAPSLSDHSKRLADSVENSSIQEEAMRVTGFSQAKIEALALRCEAEQTYLRFFSEMRIGKRRILIKKNKGGEIFAYLSLPTVWSDFLSKLEPMRSLKLPTDEKDLKSFLDGYPQFQNDMKAFSDLWKNKVGELERVTLGKVGKQSLAEWLVATTEDEASAWRVQVESIGFSLDEAKLTRVRELLKTTIARDQIEMKLRTTEMVKKWRETFFSSSPLDAKMLRLTDPKVVEMLGSTYSKEELEKVLAWVKYERGLRKLEKWVDLNGESKSGSIIGGRKIFLALIAFLVCVVGITNAMLMSVTERFMEIATMKCLGATDGFILKQFVLEAGFQGLLGGLMGMIVGLVVAILKNLIQLGTPTLTYFPTFHVFVCAITAVICGIVLAMLAAIYPSWSASRMAPMEAMRVE